MHIYHIGIVRWAISYLKAITFGLDLYLTQKKIDC